MIAVSQLFSDGAVLQRDKPIMIWGKASPLMSLELDLDSNSTFTQSDNHGEWFAQLPPHSAGGPYTMTILVRDDQVREVLQVKDLLFGDVWLLAGQSNMELWMSRLASRYGENPSGSNDEAVRFFSVPQKTDFHGPQTHLMDGKWTIIGRNELSAVSGVGFFFARALRAKRPDVPLALLQTAVGGTPIEAWMDQQSLCCMGLSSDNYASLSNDVFLRLLAKEHDRAENDYQNAVQQLDYGLSEHWEAVDYDDSKWGEIALNQAGPQQHELSGPGVVWFRKKIRIPDEFVGKSGHLLFGTMLDADECFINGSFVGSTGYRYPPRNYIIPRITRYMTLAFRLRIDSPAGGGFTPKNARELLIDNIHGGVEHINVDGLGKWKYKKSTDLPDAPMQRFLAYEQSGCFNAMISPLSGVVLSGVLWYQGESNATRAPQRYSDKLMTLIQAWRKLFGNPDLPFLFVQLPNIGFEARGWARLRDEQRKALVLKQTAMITSLGSGDDNDLHPLDKQTIGDRLAYAADSLVYGANHPAMGPLISSAVHKQGSLILRFTQVGDGLCASSEVPFELSNTGGFVDTAVVVGEISSQDTVTVALECDEIFGPNARIRYAWGESPRSVLKNSDGLLASPFEIFIQ